MFKTTSKTKVLTENTKIEKDGYTSIEITNLGTDTAKINNNIPLAPDATWSWLNYPGVEIDEPTDVQFAGVVGHTQKVLVQMFYSKDV